MQFIQKNKKLNDTNSTCFFRPWDNYKIITEKENFKVKIIEVLPNHRLSLQRHKHRSEHWVIVNGQGLMTLNKDNFEVKTGDYISIGQTCVHRIKNISKNEKLRFIETQYGKYLGEDDIERSADDYGRIHEKNKSFNEG